MVMWVNGNQQGCEKVGGKRFHLIKNKIKSEKYNLRIEIYMPFILK